MCAYVFLYICIVNVFNYDFNLLLASKNFGSFKALIGLVVYANSNFNWFGKTIEHCHSLLLKL